MTLSKITSQEGLKGEEILPFKYMWKIVVWTSALNSIKDMKVRLNARYNN